MSKILMVAERYIPIWGGAENQLRQLIPYLLAENHLVTVVTRRWQGELPRHDVVDGVSVIRLGIPGETSLATMFFIYHLFVFLIWNGRKFDIFHSHGAVKMGVICRLASLLNGRNNIAKIATAGKIAPLKRSLSGRVLLYFFKQSDAVICMTKEIEEELYGIGFPERKIALIPNAVDCMRFFRQHSESERKLFRKNLNVPEDACLVLFAGRLVHRKGLDVLVRAWHGIAESGKNIYLLIIGSGKGQPDTIEPEIKKQIKDKQISNILFIGETDNPELYLANGDIFVFPSRQEGFPNALMEAMASELAVVASRIGGNVELVEDSKTGLLFEQGNQKELCDCLKRFYENQELMRNIGFNARRQMEEFYSFPRIVEYYNKLYSKLS